MKIKHIFYPKIQISIYTIRLIFIALPKKTDANECKLHGTIRLMRYIIKHIPTNRMHSRIRSEIGKEQCGMVKGTGTSTEIFTLKIISARVLHMQKDV